MASRRRRNVVVLGNVGSGKTSLIAGLEVITDPNRPCGFAMDTEGSSKQALRAMAWDLRRGGFPPSTTGRIEVDITVEKGGEEARFRWIDYRGEDFEAHFDRGERSFEEHVVPLPEVDVFLFAIAPEDLEQREGRGPGGGRDDGERRSALRDAFRKVRRMRKNRPERETHIAVLLTKADVHFPQPVGPAEASAFLDEHHPHLAATLRRDLGDIRVFPVSAVGTPDRGLGAPVEPWGYEELIDWMVSLSREERSQDLLRWAKRAAAVAAIAGAAWWTIGALSSSRVSLVDLVHRGIHEPADLDPAHRAADPKTRRAAVDGALERAATLLAIEGSRFEELDSQAAQLRFFAGRGSSYRRKAIEEMSDRLARRIGEVLADRARAAYDQGREEELDQMAEAYLRRFPEGERRDEMSSLLEKRNRTRLLRNVSALMAERVDDREALRRYAEALGAFLDAHPDVHPEEGRRAVALIGRLADEAAGLEMVPRRIGRMRDGKKAHFEVSLRHGGEALYAARSAGATAALVFEDEQPLRVPWSPRSPLELRVSVDEGLWSSEVEAARVTLDGPLAVAQLDGRLQIPTTPEGVGLFEGDTVVLDADIRGWDEADWELLRAWAFRRTRLKDMLTNE